MAHYYYNELVVIGFEFVFFNTLSLENVSGAITIQICPNYRVRSLYDGRCNIDVHPIIYNIEDAVHNAKYW